MRIIVENPLEEEESSFCKQLRSSNDFFGPPPPRIFCSANILFPQLEFYKIIKFFCVLKKEENGVRKKSETLKHLFGISSRCLLSYLNFHFKGNRFFWSPPHPHSAGQRRVLSQYIFEPFSAGEIALKFPNFET